MGTRELVASASRSASGPSLLALPSCCWMCASSRSAASATAAARFCSTWAFQGSGHSCGSWASASSPTSGSVRRPDQAPRRLEMQRGPPSPSASSPFSAGWRSP